jgi:hypothetical protein
MTLRSIELERRRLTGYVDPRVDRRFDLDGVEVRGAVNDRELWCADIDYLLNVADSEMGEHGTYSGFLSVMERGGPDGAVCAGVAPPQDNVLGSGARYAAGLAEGAVARVRRLSAIYERQPREVRAVHVARYRTLSQHWPGADGQLGWLKGVVVLVHDEKALEKIMKACEKAGAPPVPGKAPRRDPHRPVIERALKVAEGIVRAAHRCWWLHFGGAPA